MSDNRSFATPASRVPPGRRPGFRDRHCRGFTEPGRRTERGEDDPPDPQTGEDRRGGHPRESRDLARLRASTGCIRLSYEKGVRTYDTAAVYGSEPNFKKWFAEKPEVRKSIFLVSKTQARSVDQFIADIDKRLEQTGTDYLDLYFWHAMGDHREEVAFCKSPEFGKAIEKIKESGKAKFVGFSTHNVRRAEIHRGRGRGRVHRRDHGPVQPVHRQRSPLNKALDAAHKAGIGLISMKQSAGQMGGGRGLPTPLQEAVTKLAPGLKERGISAFQGLLQAIWTDERMATSCVTMNNTRPGPREHRGRPEVRAAQGGRVGAASRRLPRRQPDLLRRLRRQVRRGRRDRGRAGRPRPASSPITSTMA